MDLSLYKPSELELWIDNHYQDAGIHSVHDLDIDHVASVFGAIIQITSGQTKVLYDDEIILILLNQNLSEPKKREAFFHELCHSVRHAGNQNSMRRDFMELQEIQAGLFQLYASMPFYLVMNYEEYLYSPNVVPLMAYEFRVSPELVTKRLEQIKARIQKSIEVQEIFDSVPRRPEPTIIAHSPETLKMLAKLSWLSAQRGRKVNWG